MRIVQTIAIIGWIAGALFGADVKTPAAHQREPIPKSAPSKGAATARPQLPDAQLEAAIRAKFAKSKSAPEKFQVHVQGGVATIEGRTDVIQHKGGATRMAKSAGAVAVVNHIQISDAARAKSAANLEKGRRRAQLKRGDVRSEVHPTR